MNRRTIVAFTNFALAGVVLASGCRTTGPGKRTSAATQDERAAVVERHSAADRARSGIALGGLGTGSVELRKDGQFYNWTIFNNQPLGTGPAFDFATYPNNDALESMQFFVVRYQEQ